ncbi:hypothetical protein MNBD_DELTA02-1214 [hydrothermal vent metagenome]|uniref:Uncharacterized protein n=1 Tax=hydrothermal vent metagenome TaxID=652676 RepID=A0A3B0V3K3_9ZZZZ
MKVKVKVILRNRVVLPEGAVCRVELRDESMVDGPAGIVASYEEPVKEVSGIDLMACTLEGDDDAFAGRDVNVWAHLSLTGEKQVRVGDFITMQAYPVGGVGSAKAAGSAKAVTVELQPVSS